MNRNLKIPVCVFIIFTAFSFLPCHLNARELPEGFNQKKVPLKFIKECTAEKYPNSDSVLAYDYEKYKYEADGTSVKWDDCYETILTEKGKRDNSVMSFHFSLPYSTVDVLLVELIKKNGDIVKIDIEKNSKEMIDRSQMSQNIYNPNDKIFQVTVPGLDVGDTLHYIWKKNTVKARVPNTWSDYYVLEYTKPIKYYKVDINAPKKLPLKNIKLRAELLGKVAFEKQEKEQRIIYSWTTSDVPRMFPEPNMPKIYTVTQRLLVSTIPDWEFISKWYWNLCKPHIDKVTPEMKKKVAELIKGKKTEMEKIQAIFTFVSQEIRYMGITTETEAPGYEPHDINVTFENRYGVCRDKAALLVGMLRLAGLKAYPVIINNGPKKDKAVPQPYFNHAISCVESSNGTYILMDSTDENTKRICPAYLCNKSYLVAKPDGETLLTSEIIPADENMMKISTKGKLTNNTLEAKTSFLFEGINDNAYRGYFTRLKDKERRKFFETHLKRLFPGASLKSLVIKPENLMDTSKSLNVEANYTVPSFTMDTTKYTLIPPAWIGTSFGMVNFTLGKTGLQKRKYPLKTDIACGVTETFSIEVDQEYELASNPSYKTIDNKELLWKQKLMYKDMILSGKSDFQIKAVEFSTKQYTELKAALKEIEYNKRKQPIFNKQESKNRSVNAVPGYDAEIVSSLIEINLNDNHSWTTTESVTKRVLTYNGKKDASELIFNYNPVWETVELLKAQVTTNGVTKKLGKDELNIMDAKWVGSAPRYPGAKTLVANLPGVEIGSTIEYVVKRTVKNKLFFSIREYFRSDIPIKSKKVTLTKAINLNLAMAYQNGDDIFTAQPSVKGELIKYAWNSENIAQIEPERYQPPAWTAQPTLLLSTGNWTSYTEELKAKVTECSNGQSEAEDKAEELVEGLESANNKIKAIRDFVAKMIRTDGPRYTELPISLLSNADDTLKAGYGHEADQAILLKTMLNAVGIESEIVLTGSLPAIGSVTTPVTDTPQIDVFSSVLVKVEIDNDTILLNDTDQYAELGVVDHQDKIAMLLSEGELHKVTANDSKSDRIKVVYTIDLEKNGNAVIRKEKDMWGNHHAAFKRKFTEMKAEQKRRYEQELASSVSQSAELKGKVKSQFDTYPAKESYELYIPRFAVVDKEFGYLKLPAQFLNRVIPQLSDTRKSDYFRSNSMDLSVEFNINLPATAHEVEHIPAQLEWVSPNDSGSIKVTSSKKGKTITVKYDLKLKPAIFTEDQIKQVREIGKQLIHKSMKLILYRS